MATWTSISNAAVAVGGIPSSTTVTALRDNPSAIAETASGAPVVFSGWHPYDKVTIGDGKDGVIYDFSVSGASTNFETPNFVDGYEYRLFGTLDGFTSIELYREVTADWIPSSTTTVLSGWHDYEISMPRVPKLQHLMIGAYSRTGTNTGVSVAAKFPSASGADGSVLNKILKARFVGTGSSGAKIWMFRRREYASSP
jgi:hypothetical protein